MSKSVDVDFSFFTSDAAKNIKVKTGNIEDEKKKSPKKNSTASAQPITIHEVAGTNSGGVAEVDYAKSYAEGSALIRGAIGQADDLATQIKEDIDSVRASKTIKNKYTYITNLTQSASSLLTTKINAIKELNSTVTNIHNLELNRLKALKVNESEGNDDMRMMDLYSSFVNTPIGSYAPSVPSIQDITLGTNSVNSSISGVDVGNSGFNSPAALTPEQNRMRMESNPNIKTVVKFNQATGHRYFDVIDMTSGVSVPNYPRPEAFLLEDTTIDVHSGLARNRNINQVWPLVLDGGNVAFSEY